MSGSTISCPPTATRAFEFTWPVIAALFATFGLTVFFTAYGMQPPVAMLHATIGMALFVVSVVVPLRIIDMIRHLRSLALLGSMGLNANAFTDLLIHTAVAAQSATAKSTLAPTTPPRREDVGRL